MLKKHPAKKGWKFPGFAAKSMMGFKLFEVAEATLSGIELYHMLKKGLYKDFGEMTVFEQFYALAA